MTDAPDAPDDCGDAGRALWSDITTEYELDEHELALLREIVHTVDVLAELRAIAKSDGLVIESPQGGRTHPALIEARQQRIALARLLAALRMPAGEDGDRQAGARPQRRYGVRGAYRPRGVAS
ncbi:MAG: hypothetical protein ACRDPQ_14030 [Nocardioidaceae bacterium]